MTTCVVVKKGGEVAIAADSLVTFGDTRLARGYEQNQKIFQVGESLIALAGTTAHFPVMRSLLAGLADECRLGTRDDVFRTFLKVHEKLKDEYFVNTKEDDDDPYESSQITCLIANPTGIYGVYCTARCSRSTASGASARGAISRWGRCRRCTTCRDGPRPTSRRLACRRAWSSTRVQAARSRCTRCASRMDSAGSRSEGWVPATRTRSQE